MYQPASDAIVGPGMYRPRNYLDNFLRTLPKNISSTTRFSVISFVVFFPQNLRIGDFLINLISFHFAVIPNAANSRLVAGSPNRRRPESGN